MLKMQQFAILIMLFFVNITCYEQKPILNGIISECTGIYIILHSNDCMIMVDTMYNTKELSDFRKKVPQCYIGGSDKPIDLANQFLKIKGNLLLSLRTFLTDNGDFKKIGDIIIWKNSYYAVHLKLEDPLFLNHKNDFSEIFKKKLKKTLPSWDWEKLKKRAKEIIKETKENHKLLQYVADKKNNCFALTRLIPELQELILSYLQ